MHITEVIINNYKSIGKERNVLHLERSITAIIGKNESGKSNVLEAIGDLPYYNKPNQGFYQNNKNRRLNEDISIIFILDFDDSDIEQLNISYDISYKSTELTFSSDTTASVSGAMSEIIANDSELMAKIKKLDQIKESREIWNIGSNEKNKKQLNHLINSLKDCPNVILLNFEQEINTLKKILNHPKEKNREVSNTIDEISSILTNYYSLLPNIYYRKHDVQLEYSYDLEKINESLKNNGIIRRLIVAAGIDEDDMVRAFTEKIEGEKQNIRWEIIEKISKNIGERFNEFYSQETVKFRPHFDGNTLKFSVITNEGKSMMITERSNGLRWYLSLFIDVLANDYQDNSVLFLFDEPGVHLHVNAQKEILALFDDLCKQGHQVLYTTHSPSMINGENILNVRVVEKKVNGDTVIYKSGYDQRLSSESKMETLSPLVKAIGADMRFNLGPQFLKNNIITEGITDYMYIKALLHYLNVIDSPNIIPSAGVDNVNRIASILMGWGCDFFILLDYDEQGRREYNVLIKKLDVTLKQYIVFVNGEDTPSQSEMRSSPKTIEDLISDEDKDKLTNKLDKDDKVLVAKEFHDKVISGKLIPESQTVEAFKKIFRKLDIVAEDRITV